MTTKNLLLIGKTGNGKSTLANVLTQSAKFTESAGSTSQTRIIQAEQFKHNEQSYSIIDTPGFFDTKLKQEEILDIIAEAVYLVKDGLSQVFFVSKGRFDHYEMSTYNILREIIFDKCVSDYTTLVRTNFVDFDNKEECEKDLEAMKCQDDFKDVIEACSLRLIHVNNPSLGVGK